MQRFFNLWPKKVYNMPTFNKHRKNITTSNTSTCKNAYKIGCALN